MPLASGIAARVAAEYQRNLADPHYDLRYTPQLPVNSYTDDRFETFAGYVQEQAAYGPLHLTGGLRVTSLKFIVRRGGLPPLLRAS